jgi:hypothetical protein
MSDDFARDSKPLAHHCVSHPIADYFGGFFNDYREFRAHYVSHHLEAKSGRHRAWALRDGLPKSSAKAVGLLLGGVLLSPSLARLAVPLSLAPLVTAHSLAIAGSRMWLEPPTADPARALAGHPDERRLGRARPPRPAVLAVVDGGASLVTVCGGHLRASPGRGRATTRRVTFHEQTRVIFGER